MNVFNSLKKIDFGCIFFTDPYLITMIENDWSKIGKRTLFQIYHPHQKSKDEKQCNENLLHCLNDPISSVGDKLKDNFCRHFPNLEIIDTKKAGGDRRTSYDFKVVVKDIFENVNIKTVELKSSQQKMAIDPLKDPWTNAVQGLNGNPKLFTPCEKYVEHVYHFLISLIGSDAREVPSLETYKKDIYRMGKPNTEFVKHLKSNTKKYDLDNQRRIVNQNFTISEEDLVKFAEEINTFVIPKFSQKDFWLQVRGSLESPDDFECHWSGPVHIGKIIKVKMVPLTKLCSDINFECLCEDGKKINAKMRWGYGQLVTNLRIDFR